MTSPEERPGFFSSLSALCFPPLCVTCDKLLREEPPESLFCVECFRRITITMEPLCSRCGTPFLAGTSDSPQDLLCGECRADPPAFSRARTFGAYEGPLLEAIHLFKYRQNLAAGERLGTMMARRCYESLDIGSCERIIPVPLHPARLRKRGFNQSLVLARRIADEFGLPVDTRSLNKVSPGEPQVGLGRDRRRENLRGAFSVEPNSGLEGRKVLLVDDVYTTGSTARECALVLAASGAADVAVLALARAR